MVKVVNHFNEDNVPKKFKAHNAKMNQIEVNGAERLTRFCQVVIVPIYERSRSSQPLGIPRGSITRIVQLYIDGGKPVQIQPMGGIIEDPPACYTCVPRV